MCEDVQSRQGIKHPHFTNYLVQGGKNTSTLRCIMFASGSINYEEGRLSNPPNSLRTSVIEVAALQGQEHIRTLGLGNQQE